MGEFFAQDESTVVLWASFFSTIKGPCLYTKISQTGKYMANSYDCQNLSKLEYVHSQIQGEKIDKPRIKRRPIMAEQIVVQLIPHWILLTICPSITFFMEWWIEQVQILEEFI